MIKIYRQYRIMNGYVQLPPNILRTETLPSTPTGASLGTKDGTYASVADVKVKNSNDRFLEFWWSNYGA